MKTPEDTCICRRIPGILVACLVMLLFAPVNADDLTLVCDYCGKPITGAYIVTDSGTYHESCYEDHVAPRCAVCGQIINGEYFIDHWRSLNANIAIASYQITPPAAVIATVTAVTYASCARRVRSMKPTKLPRLWRIHPLP